MEARGSTDDLRPGASAVVARMIRGFGSLIVRHSPVPVVVVPRGAARALAERAEQGSA
jgi:predicted GNAT family acetyltransferase